MRRALLVGFFVLLSPSFAQAADRYVRQGATGANNGTDWTNAYASAASCETAMQRSGQDVCWIAAGSYGSVTLNTPSSGTNVLTFRKATVANHGTGVGWNDGYAGQATFDSILLGSDHWMLDGQVRNESNWADGPSYGFRVTSIVASTAQTPGVCAANVVVQYFNIGGAEGTTYTGSEPGEAIYHGGFDETCRNWTIARNYLHNIASYTMVQFAGTDTATVEYNHFRNGWGKEAIRGQNIARNLVIRFNQFYNACGNTGLPGEGCTAEIASWGGGAGAHDNHQIYGNWFYRTRHENSGGTIVVGGDGVSWLGAPTNDTLVYNNTVAGISGAGVGGNILVNGGSGNICRNNLWYDTVSSGVDCTVSSNNTRVTNSPFVDYGAGNLRLSGPTPAGTMLSTPFNRDMDGIARGTDGTWDLGAYEFGTSSPPVDAGSPDSGTVDGGEEPDSGTRDAGTTDAGTPDTNSPEGEPPASCGCATGRASFAYVLLLGVSLLRRRLWITKTTATR